MRPGKIEYYLDIAAQVARRSTCIRRQYGAILVRDDAIVATGYNGAARGEPNCCDLGYCEREAQGIKPGERYELCLEGNTVVKLLDGSHKTIKELAESAEDVWVYSVDTQTGKIVPALATSPRSTGRRGDLVRVTFDNGASVISTKDHLFLMRDCSYIEAGQLRAGDSVMPMYYNFATNKGYESISNTILARKYGGRIRRGDWLCETYSTPTHQIVYSHLHGNQCLSTNFLVHHKDGDHTNNKPDNLELMARGAHTTIHRLGSLNPSGKETIKVAQSKVSERRLLDPDFNNAYLASRRETMNKNWADPEWRTHIRPTQVENGRRTAQKYNKDPEVIARRSMGMLMNGIKSLAERSGVEPTSNNYKELAKKHKIAARKGEKGPRAPKLSTILRHFESVEAAYEAARIYNHKVVSTEDLSGEPREVYDLTVPGYENFAVDLGDNSCVFVHNCRSVHAEANACLHAGRDRCIGATLYLAGWQGDQRLDSPKPCAMCARVIRNCGIEEVIC